MKKTIDYKNVLYPPGGILMWIIIFLELFTFGIALIALVVTSKENPELFHESRLKLNSTFGAINTIFLLTSGFFMALSTSYFKQNDIIKGKKNIRFAIIGGILFLLLKSVEYYLKIHLGIGVNYNTFFTYYWLLTIFHLIHVIVGLIILVSVLNGLKKNTANIEDIEASATFWHMCDLIWLLLFPILYLTF